jgi:hypothetical protein
MRGFGCIILLDHGWADWVAMQRSFDLFARFALPKYAGRNAWRVDSMAAADRVKAAARHTIERYFESTKDD